MNAGDVMTSDVVSVYPDTGVAEIAGLMRDRRISAVPVVDADGHVVGIVSERDLMRRPESQTERLPSWWLRLITAPDKQIADYIKTRGTRAGDVMTATVISVVEDTSVREIARLLEEHRIKRVPVIRAGKLVGIVSRADLLRILAGELRGLQAVSADDGRIRDQIIGEMERQPWSDKNAVNPVVVDGVVHLYGTTHNLEERRALVVAVERTPGVRAIEDHLVEVPHWWANPWEEDYY